MRSTTSCGVGMYGASVGRCEETLDAPPQERTEKTEITEIKTTEERSKRGFVFGRSPEKYFSVLSVTPRFNTPFTALNSVDPNQWKMMNDPSGIAIADTSPHTGTGPASALCASSVPERFVIRHATVPPRFHAVPSVHASR